jgi:hypothetical protein
VSHPNIVNWDEVEDWQRGERGEDVVCEVGPGTCLVQLATGPAHTLVAGQDGLDVLAYGERGYAIHSGFVQARPPAASATSTRP